MLPDRLGPPLRRGQGGSDDGRITRTGPEATVNRASWLDNGGGTTLGGWVVDAEALPRYDTDMPEISRFLGIVIGMFPRDHPPPHFHAVYGEYQITVDIETGVVHGDFPARALRLVLEWLALHEAELLEDWDLVLGGRPAKRIAPLE